MGELTMSDVEGDDVPSAAPVATGPMDINTAIQEVLKQALIGDGLARGLREAAKALDKRPCCVSWRTTVTSPCTRSWSQLCQEHGIPLIKVDSNMKLGEWAGLCKIDQDGKARKVVKCSAAVVRDWGSQGPAHDVLQDYLKAKK